MLYAAADFRATRDEKFSLLKAARHVYNLQLGLLKPDQKHTWLTDELSVEFETMLPIGTKATKSMRSDGLFRVSSTGVSTDRDAWVYNFRSDSLFSSVKLTLDTYCRQVHDFQRLAQPQNVDDFVMEDPTLIGWSRKIKYALQRGDVVQFDKHRIRESCYRPFTKAFMYFDPFLVDFPAAMPRIFPTAESQWENRAICVTDIGSEKPFMTLITNCLTDRHLVGAGCGTQCFSFYIYDEDGTNRCENITGWAVEQFTSALQTSVEKWNIFYYVYGVLHSPEYRKKYEANLKRELPRIPLPKTTEQFHAFVTAGERLADLQVNYESQPEYRLVWRENPKKPLDWRVEKMKLTKDKTAIVYNDFLTLAGIPPEAFEYKLGNRSALEWIIDRYQIHTDKRSGIVNDPNRADDQQYIVKLIGKIITVSLETMKIVKSLPGL